MFGNYLKVAFRNLWRNKAFALINISGLAIGLACCIMILLFVRSQTGYDQYNEKKDRLYRLTPEVEGLKTGDVWRGATSSIPWAPALKQEYPEVEEVCRVMGERGEHTFLAGVIALLIAFYAVSTQAVKAALANPVESLRYE